MAPDEMVEAAASVLEPYLSFLDEDKLDWLVRAALTAALAARPEQEPVSLADRLAAVPTKDTIQREREEAYKVGWDDGYAEGYGKAGSDQRRSAAPLAQPGREELVEALAKAEQFMATAISRMRAAHIGCMDMVNEFEEFARETRRLIGGPDAQT